MFSSFLGIDFLFVGAVMGLMFATPYVLLLLSLSIKQLCEVCIFFCKMVIWFYGYVTYLIYKLVEDKEEEDVLR